ncbi:MAG TPA: GAF domain-containing protein [Candidatus Angelobacter sp.]|nr:GAF domain-containing protein [Candidatus Angelobacter sp.]
MQPIIESAVAEVLKAALPGLQQEVAARVAAAVGAAGSNGAASSTALLSAAATQIQESGSQTEILRNLLEGCSRFASRVALFVAKAGSVTGWQGTGFENNEEIKTASVSATGGLSAEAMNGRVPAAGKATDFDAGFLSLVKAPAEDRCLVLPLVVKDRVAALIYADAGREANNAFDASALSVLTRFAALWLETGTTRKSDSAAAAAAAPEPEQVPERAAAPVSAPVAHAAAAAATVPEAAASEDAELHKKAKRFAKLLVEEIMLYNQGKVAQGKKNQDLYTRLREDIEKSRATYDKRYGEGPAASANYFNQELVRILADSDVSLMGDGFPR